MNKDQIKEVVKKTTKMEEKVVKDCEIRKKIIYRWKFVLTDMAKKVYKQLQLVREFNKLIR